MKLGVNNMQRESKRALIKLDRFIYFTLKDFVSHYSKLEKLARMQGLPSILIRLSNLKPKIIVLLALFLSLNDLVDMIIGSPHYIRLILSIGVFIFAGLSIVIDLLEEWK